MPKDEYEGPVLTRSDLPGQKIPTGQDDRADSRYKLPSSDRALFRTPKLFVLLILTVALQIWVVTLGLGYAIDNTSGDIFRMILLGVEITAVVSIVLCLGSVVLLHTIHEYAKTQRLSLLRGLGDTLRNNIFNILVIGTIWGILWLFLTVFFGVINLFLGTRYLFSFYEASVKGDMRSSLIALLPAVAWENASLDEAWKRGDVVLEQTRDFSESNSLNTLFIILLLLIPILFLPSLTSGTPRLVVFISYFLLLGNYLVFTRQIFMSQLYLFSYKIEQIKAADPTRITPIDITEVPILPFFKE